MDLLRKIVLTMTDVQGKKDGMTDGDAVTRDKIRMQARAMTGMFHIFQYPADLKS